MLCPFFVVYKHMEVHNMRQYAKPKYETKPFIIIDNTYAVYRAIDKRRCNKVVRISEQPTT